MSFSYTWQLLHGLFILRAIYRMRFLRADGVDPCIKAGFHSKRYRKEPDGQITKSLSSPFAKNILVFRRGKSLLYPRRPVPLRGAFRDRHECGTGCGGR